MSRFSRFALVVALAILVAGHVSQTRGATSYAWQVASGDWTTPANWSPSGPPGVGDYAYIANGGAATVGALEAATCGTLSLGTSGGLLGGIFGGLRINLDGSLADANEYVGGMGIGGVSQSGGFSIVSNELSVGDSLGSSGTYSLSGGSLLSSGVLNLGNAGNGAFIQTGGTVNVQGQGMFAGNARPATGAYSVPVC
jgi:hypothetical protein